MSKKAFGDRLLIDNLSFSVPPGRHRRHHRPQRRRQVDAVQDDHRAGEAGRGDRDRATVKLAYVDQSRDKLDGNHNVFQEVSGGLDILNIGGVEIQSRAYIGRFNFKGRDQQKLVGRCRAANAAACTWRRRCRRRQRAAARRTVQRPRYRDLRALEDALLEFPATRSSFARPLVPDRIRRTSSPSRAIRTWSSSRATTDGVAKRCRSAPGATGALSISGRAQERSLQKRRTNDLHRKTLQSLAAGRFAGLRRPDPDPAKFPDAFVDDDDALFSFCRDIADATAGSPARSKPQIAYFAAHNDGEAAAAADRAHRREPPGRAGDPDAKRRHRQHRGAIRGRLRRFGADAVTLNPYMGRDSAAPFLQRDDRGCVFRATPPTRRARLPELDVGGEFYQRIARTIANEWNADGNCALVVGATFPQELKAIRGIVGDMPLLILSVGAQGGDVEAVVRNGKTADGTGLMINSSRGILYASNGAGYADAAASAANPCATRSIATLIFPSPPGEGGAQRRMRVRLPPRASASTGTLTSTPSPGERVIDIIDPAAPRTGTCPRPSRTPRAWARHRAAHRICGSNAQAAMLVPFDEHRARTRRHAAHVDDRDVVGAGDHAARFRARAGTGRGLRRAAGSPVETVDAFEQRAAAASARRTASTGCSACAGSRSTPSCARDGSRNIAAKSGSRRRGGIARSVLADQIGADQRRAPAMRVIMRSRASESAATKQSGFTNASHRGAESAAPWLQATAKPGLSGWR